MRIITQGSRGQGYKDLKKVLNAKTKDEVIIKLLKNYKKLEEIIDKCAYCSEELV